MLLRGKEQICFDDCIDVDWPATLKLHGFDAVDAQVEIAELKKANARLLGLIGEAARHMRLDLTPRTLNEAVRALNRALPKDERVPEFSWGTTTPTALRDAVRTLGYLVGMEWQEKPMVLAEREEVI